MSSKPGDGMEQGTTNGKETRNLANMCKHQWYGGTYGTQKPVVKRGPENMTGVPVPGMVKLYQVPVPEVAC